MRGLDALAAACAPQEQTTPPEAYAALTDEQCQKIASIVLQTLQGGTQKTEPEQAADPEPDQLPEEGENEDES